MFFDPLEPVQDALEARIDRPRLEERRTLSRGQAMGELDSRRIALDVRTH